MRKWYGETDKMLLPKDGKPAPGGDEDEYEGPRDAILVTDADSPMGELIVLQLVLARVKIKVLVKDVVKAKQEFGPYVDAVAGDSKSGSALQKAMQGAKAVIVTGPTGQAVRAAAALGLEHVVLLASKADGGGFLGGLLGGADSALRDRSRVEEVRRSPVPFTVITYGKLMDRLGGDSYIEFTQGDGAAPGALSREDAALVAVRALLFPPSPGSGLEFCAGGAGVGRPPAAEEWAPMFEQLQTVQASAAASA